MAMAIGELLLEKSAQRVAQRGTDALFDRALERYGEEEGLTEDETEFIRETIDLVTEFEVAFRFHVKSRGDDAELEQFKESARPLKKRATELAVVAEMRSYRGGEAELLDTAAVAADFFAIHLTDAEDLADTSAAMEFYRECDIARDLIETVADEFG